MISFDDFCSVEGVPTYLQMIRHVKQGLAADVMQNGEKLLSRRLLSTTLAVNPNTAQKATARGNAAHGFAARRGRSTD